MNAGDTPEDSLPRTRQPRTSKRPGNRPVFHQQPKHNILARLEWQTGLTCSKSIFDDSTEFYRVWFRSEVLMTDDKLWPDRIFVGD